MNDTANTSSHIASPAWSFDHINVSVGTRHALSALFEGVMGLQPGFRPPFPSPGLWLYAGDQALVHAVDDTRLSTETEELSLGHIAFRSEQPASQVIERLQSSKVVVADPAGFPEEDEWVHVGTGAPKQRQGLTQRCLPCATLNYGATNARTTCTSWVRWSDSRARSWTLNCNC